MKKIIEIFKDTLMPQAVETNCQEIQMVKKEKQQKRTTVSKKHKLNNVPKNNKR
jgi:hypothetical protein